MTSIGGHPTRAFVVTVAKVIKGLYKKTKQKKNTNFSGYLTHALSGPFLRKTDAHLRRGEENAFHPPGFVTLGPSVLKRDDSCTRLIPQSVNRAPSSTVLTWPITRVRTSARTAHETRFVLHDHPVTAFEPPVCFFRHGSKCDQLGLGRQARRAVGRVWLPAGRHRHHRILRPAARVQRHRRAPREAVERRGYGQRRPEEMAVRWVTGSCGYPTWCEEFVLIYWPSSVSRSPMIFFNGCREGEERIRVAIRHHRRGKGLIFLGEGGIIMFLVT